MSESHASPGESAMEGQTPASASTEGDLSGHPALSDQVAQVDATPQDENDNLGLESLDSKDSETLLEEEMMSKLKEMTDGPSSDDIEQFLDEFRPLWTKATEETEEIELTAKPLISPLHIMAQERSFDFDPNLIPHIVHAEPDMMLIKNAEGKNAMQIAIERKNYPVLTAMLDNCENIDEAMRYKTRFREGNCLHLAFYVPIKRRYLLALIKRASLSTLSDQDAQGRTPLHLAVDYRMCVPEQVEIVRELLVRCDSALDLRARDGLSVYQHHLKSMEANMKKADPKNNNDRASGQLYDHNNKFKYIKRNMEKDNWEPVNDGTSSQNYGFWDEMMRERPSPPAKPKHTKARSLIPSRKTAGEIAFMLKVHYLRSTLRLDHWSPSQAQSFFGFNESGPTPVFSFEPQPTPPVDRQDFERTCESFKFFNVMRVVSLPAKFEVRDDQRRVRGKARWSLHVPFEWLHSNEHTPVDKIIRVVADDLNNEPHSDESIEKVLGPLKVEELDWRKMDMCPRTLRRIGDELRVLYLYWGGNNAILRSWSEPDGLPRLRKLQRIHVSIPKISESPERVEEDLSDFSNRLGALRPTLRVDLTRDWLSADVGLPSARSSRSREGADQWFEIIMKFSKTIHDIRKDLNVDSWRKQSVAIIDSPVDIFDRDLMGHIGSATSSENVRPKLVEGVSHGTHIAKAIIRMANGHIKPLIVSQSEFSSMKAGREPSDLEFITKAVIEAISLRVDIICMAWPVGKSGRESLEFRYALREASHAGITLIAQDDGVDPGERSVYQVGSVDASLWPRVARSDNERHHPVFVLPSPIPGINRGQMSGIESNDSVAPALATGLAVLLFSLWDALMLSNKLGLSVREWSVDSKEAAFSGFIRHLERQQQNGMRDHILAWEPFKLRNYDGDSKLILTEVLENFRREYGYR